MKPFDVVLVGDFRFPGGTSVATSHEIRALAGAGLSIGLIQANAPLLRQQRPMHQQIRACVNDGQATVIPAGTRKVEAGLGILHSPFVFTDPLKQVPDLHLGRSILVAHQSHTDRNGVPYYDAARVQAICDDVAGGQVEWAPISPIVRGNLKRTAPGIPLLDNDWHNIVFPEDWATKRAKPLKKIPVIGRHGRPDRDKWPATRRDILQVYPDDPKIDVRLLGTGDHLKRLVGEYPANWATYRFGQIDARQFLKTIDFFVYYHHPDWIEAFGRTVLEACASGSVAVLPPHFEATFGDAALYCPASDAIALVRELHGDWRRYVQQSNRALRFVDARHGPEHHVQFIKDLLGRAEPKARNAKPSTNKRPIAMKKEIMPAMRKPAHDDQAFDVVIAADMRTPGDVALRIAHEIRIQHTCGLRTALVHAPAGRIKASSVRGEINACVREGLAKVLTPSDDISAKILVVHGPEDILEPIPEKLPRIKAEKVIVVADRIPDRSYSLIRKHRLLSLAFQVSPVWAPASAKVREALLKAWPEVPLEVEDWTISLAARPWKERVFRWDRPVVGMIDSELPLLFNKDDKSEMKPVELPSVSNCYARVLQAASFPDDLPPGPLDRLRVEEQAMGKFLDSLDFLFVPPDENRPAPMCAIAEAMQRGVIVLAKPELARELGAGALGYSPGKADEIVKMLARHRAELCDMSREASRNASARFSMSHHADRLARLTGRPAAPAISKHGKRQRIAFISSNGVGLGHLTRLLCIARRLPDTVDPIFVTMSQAFGIVKDFGFPVEYVPFQTQSELSSAQDWNDWFRHHIEQVFDAYGITGAVFDGGAPYGGLVRAIASRPDFFSVWVRRGMWRAGKHNDNLVKRQKYFDLVIEPRDIADSRDDGPTAAQFGRSAHVDPIRLLDQEELLDRRSAAKAIGIDPKRPAVLVQLGSGTTSEIVSQTNDVIKACAKFPQLQVVIAEWAIGAVSFDVWPEVKVLRGFPLSRYFNAFDFTISAVGYNSFNEIISFGLPAIFLANENPIMDDQAGRAAFAVEQGAAFMTSPDEIKDLHILIGALMQEKARAIIKVNCARIALPNGAQAAADLIARLAGEPEREQPPAVAPQIVAALPAPAKRKNKHKQKAGTKKMMERVS